MLQRENLTPLHMEDLSLTLSDQELPLSCPCSASFSEWLETRKSGEKSCHLSKRARKPCCALGCAPQVPSYQCLQHPCAAQHSAVQAAPWCLLKTRAWRSSAFTHLALQHPVAQLMPVSVLLAGCPWTQVCLSSCRRIYSPIFTKHLPNHA